MAKCKKGFKRKGNRCVKDSKGFIEIIVKNQRTILIFAIILIATIIDIFVPDPLFLIDEIGLIFLTLWWWVNKIQKLK